VNTKTLANHYSQLTPEELFRLIMAANARGDETELDRLGNAGPRITVSMLAHLPYARAFGTYSFTTYIELLDEAADYLDEFQHALNEDDRVGARKPIRRRMRIKGTTPNREELAAENAEDDADKPPLWETMDVVKMIGFLFKSHAVGWKLFCERWNADPWAAWERADFPGLNRITRTLALIQCGFVFPTTEDALRWMNTIRPIGKPELTEACLPTGEEVADRYDGEFRELVRWLGG
jgi:hypothetical protein